MKVVSLTILYFILTYSGCERESYEFKAYYDSMHFIRSGGGALEFILSPTGDFSTLQAEVIKHNPVDSIIRVTINRDINNNSIFNSFFLAVKNEVEIAGDYKPSPLHTGTFVNIYLIKDSTETEVTSIALRDSLLKFEKLVRIKIQ